MFSKFFTIVAVALSAQLTLAATCSRSYVVKEGDICDSISAANNVSTFQLAAINDAIDGTCGNLIPGNTICLGTEGEDCSTTYSVVSGDTCEGIASAHSLNTTILSLNNPQIDDGCTNIYIGEVLCVSQSVQVPASPAVPVKNSPSVTLANPVASTSLANPAASTSLADPAVSTSLADPVASTTLALQSPVANVGSNPTPTPTPTPASSGNKDGNNDDNNGDDNDDDDDEDLPFCDEI